MSHNEQPQSHFQDIGIRRRQSAPREDPSPRDTPAVGSPTAESTPREWGTDLRTAGAAGNSAGHDSLPTSLRRSSYENAPHVRFSTDVASTPIKADGSSNLRLSSESWAEGSASDALLTKRRRGSTDLSVDTAAAAATATLDRGKSHSVPRSSSIPQSSTSPRTSIEASQLSLKSRSRGFSLRRSIFNRPESERVGSASPGSVVELQDVGLSSGSQLSPQEDGSLGKRKPAGNTSVTEPPVLKRELLRPGKQKTPGLQGIAALPHYQKLIQGEVHRKPISQNFKTGLNAAWKFIFRIHDIPPSKDGRHILIEATRRTALIDERTGKDYIDNFIRSSRYTAWNFIPRQLVAQFSKLANFYFLLVSILQLIPGLSTTGTYTTIVPLMVFVSISITKEGYDDFRRYRLDKEENNRTTLVLNAGLTIGRVSKSEEQPVSSSLGPVHWDEKRWMDIRVGDIVKLERDQAAPADLILLNSSSEEGIAFVETMALDGETDLKTKQVSASLVEACNTTDKLVNFNAEIVVEDPSLDLYNFEGRIMVEDETFPLTNAEMMLRGSVLRNTSDATGMVVYSGEECKIRMNATKNPRVKAPSLQSIVNKIVIVIVVFVLLLSLCNTIAYELWKNDNLAKMWYLDNQNVIFIEIFVSFIIVFNTMIPLSLYVSMEIIKIAQMWLLNDIDMYDPASDTPMEARTSTINEELGQVTYIFSDKTGTLTDNSMKFRKLSVAGAAWLHNIDLVQEAVEDPKERLPILKGPGKSRKSSQLAKLSMADEDSRKSSTPKPSSATPYDDMKSPGGASARWTSSARPSKAQLEMQTTAMIRYMQRSPFTMFAKKARMMLLSLALCHSCLPEIHGEDRIQFKGASPDELALVQAAQELDYVVIDRRSGILTIKSFANEPQGDAVVEKYEILDVVEFSSKRKRMSVIVKFPDQRICVICKGADSVISQRLRLSDLAMQTAAEIEQRVSRRKSIEANRAIARRSEQLQRRASANRTSFTLRKNSHGTISRAPSIGSSRQEFHDDVGLWLTDVEHEVDASNADDESLYYTPRVSGPSNPRQLHSHGKSSFQQQQDDELVEETLAMDEALVIERCFQHINDFATEGLRTLMYGYRFLDALELATWKKVYNDATTSLVDRQELIEKAGELIETNLELAGATAIEDKLQKGVPETIDKLRRANIKVWMLTGDKRETAINIGYSCRLIKDYSSVTILDHESGEVEQHIAAAIVDINRDGVAHSVVVIDGQTLSLIETDTVLQALFLDLAVLADSVICCRASPSQKADLVKRIRHKVKHSVTLAIGDGANDIAMIQEAHVGIGITGKEGLHAARTSDYSIAQFRFLLKLLLVHGRWNYIRTCKYVAATFWKEMTFYLVQALYQRYNGYTGTSLYENWSLSMFNTLFTSLPVISIGIFTQDLHATTLLAVPELYTKGQRNGGFNFRVYAAWMAAAATESAIIYYCMYCLFSGSYADPTNPTQDLFPMGDLCFTAVVVLVSLKLLGLEMRNRGLPALIAGVLSVGGWALWNIILSAAYGSNGLYDVRDGLFDRFGRSLAWWAVLMAAVASCLVLEVLVKAGKYAVWPSREDAFAVMESDKRVCARFEEASVMEMEFSRHLASADTTGIAEKEDTGEAEVAELLRVRSREADVPDERIDQQISGTFGTSAGDDVGLGIKGGRIEGSMSGMLEAAFGGVRREDSGL